MTTIFPTPKKTDARISYDMFVKMQRTLERVANMKFSEDFYVRKSAGLTMVFLRPQASASRMAFHVTVSGDTATVAAGSIRFHGLADGNYPIEEAEVTLAADTEWVYVYHEKDHTESGVGSQSTEPNSAGSQWRFPLVKLEKSGSVWIRNDPICHEGDINVLLPLM